MACSEVCQARSLDLCTYKTSKHIPTIQDTPETRERTQGPNTPGIPCGKPHAGPKRQRDQQQAFRRPFLCAGTKAALKEGVSAVSSNTSSVSMGQSSLRRPRLSLPVSELGTGWPKSEHGSKQWQHRRAANPLSGNVSSAADGRLNLHNDLGGTAASFSSREPQPENPTLQTSDRPIPVWDSTSFSDIRPSQTHQSGDRRSFLSPPPLKGPPGACLHCEESATAGGSGSRAVCENTKGKLQSFTPRRGPKNTLMNPSPSSHFGDTSPARIVWIGPTRPPG